MASHASGRGVALADDQVTPALNAARRFVYQLEQAAKQAKKNKDQCRSIDRTSQGALLQLEHVSIILCGRQDSNRSGLGGGLPGVASRAHRHKVAGASLQIYCLHDRRAQHVTSTVSSRRLGRHGNPNLPCHAPGRQLPRLQTRRESSSQQRDSPMQCSRLSSLWRSLASPARWAGSSRRPSREPGRALGLGAGC